MSERLFVRELSSRLYTLKEELRRLRSGPRVYKTRDFKWTGGPQHWNKNVVDPALGICQSLYVHIEEFAPGAHSKKHGHQNEAMFYVLDGRGHEVHDGQRYDWEAGDVVIVHDGCVHQHFNDDPGRPARALVIKTKPLFMFLHLLFQDTVEPNPEEPSPTGRGYEPRD
ncbi:MAG: cupin domain-containing protein [Deltaproteobacteria bacterium]|nr:cupin domain-containing protein [Deltaproteobacteria bacterium]